MKKQATTEAAEIQGAPDGRALAQSAGDAIERHAREQAAAAAAAQEEARAVAALVQRVAAESSPEN